MYERELKDAGARLEAAGRRRADFKFDMTYQEPDPDGGGMFTVRYDVTITHVPTGKTLVTVGGIGLKWVDHFFSALEDGAFD